eukprot:7256644-Pyramimonas_sp.AAC.1
MTSREPQERAPGGHKRGPRESQESPKMPPSFGTHTSLRYKSIVQQPVRVIETPLTPHRNTIAARTDFHLKLPCGELFVILVFSKTAAPLHASCRP